MLLNIESPIEVKCYGVFSEYSGKVTDIYKTKKGAMDNCSNGYKVVEMTGYYKPRPQPNYNF